MQFSFVLLLAFKPLLHRRQQVSIIRKQFSTTQMFLGMTETKIIAGRKNSPIKRYGKNTRFNNERKAFQTQRAFVKYTECNLPDIFLLYRCRWARRAAVAADIFCRQAKRRDSSRQFNEDIICHQNLIFLPAVNL